MHYVYTYREPAPSTRIFYVGKGSAGRAWAHRYRTDRHPMTHKLRQMAAQGQEPIIDIWPADSEAEALDIEVRLIALLGRKFTGDGSLCNLATGGDGAPGLHMAEGTKEKLRALNLGKKMSPEAVAKTVAAHKGAKRSAESRARISKAHTGRVVSAATRAKMSAAHKLLSNETRAKLSIATKRAWLLRKAANLACKEQKP